MVRKGSHNSSKPSVKKAGGQFGYKRTRVKQIAQVTQTACHPLPTQWDRCHNRLPLNDALVSDRRQVFDVPAPAFDVIEHYILELLYQCGQPHVSAFPTDVTEAARTYVPWVSI